MASLKRIVEMLQRAKEGPACTEKEWERKIIPETNRKYLKKYGLEHHYNPNTPVNQDLALADRFFEAGLEMAAELGLLCTSTETIIKVSKEEILQALRDAPDHLVLGEGRDQVTMRARTPEDKNPPIFAGPLCIQVSEDLFVPISEGIFKSRKVRIQEGPSIDTVFGKPVYSGSPFETAVGVREVQLKQEAMWRVGRPGLPQMGIGSSTTEYGNLGAFHLQNSPSNRAIAIILNPSELKTNFTSFHKAIHAIGCDAYLDCGGAYAMIGGFSGSPEGCVLTNIATDLLMFTILQSDVAASAIYDMRYDSSCSRHALWANTVATQAEARHTHMMLYKLINQLAGPCTEEILYTSAAGTIATAVSGVAFQIGPRTAGGRFKNYLTPLEHWFMAEVFEASAELSLEKANEIVSYLLSTYEAGLKDPPEGKSFMECFDVKTLAPSKEWVDIADKVAGDLCAHGLPMGDPVVTRA
ncbi:MAG: monomethylamine:corrinoid methyltransferase [Bacillota bacterium]